MYELVMGLGLIVVAIAVMAFIFGAAYIVIETDTPLILKILICVLIIGGLAYLLGYQAVHEEGIGVDALSRVSKSMGH